MQSLSFERKCVLLSNHNLPAGAQHRLPRKTIRQPCSSCFQTDFSCIRQCEEQWHQQLLSYKVVFKQFEAGQSFSTPWNKGTMFQNQKVEVQVFSELERQLSTQVSEWKLKCLYHSFCAVLWAAVMVTQSNNCSTTFRQHCSIMNSSKGWKHRKPA